MNLLSWAALIFLLFFILYGLTRGFLHMLYSVGAFLLACVISLSLSPSIQSFVSQSFVYDVVNSFVQNAMSMDKDFQYYETQYETFESQTEYINTLPMPNYVKSNLIANNDYSVYNALGVSRFQSYVSLYISRLLINVACFILIFAGASFLFMKLRPVLDLEGKLKSSKNVHRFGGLLLGLIYAVLILWMLVNVATFLCGTSMGDTIYRLVSDSTPISWLYNKNFFMSLVTSLKKLAEY